MTTSLPKTAVVLGALVVGACLAAAFAFNAPQPSPTKLKLGTLADKLAVADKRGDTAQALQGMKEVTDLLADLNDRPESQRACVLAAVHVSDGFVSVARGGRWSDQDRLAENLGQCS